MQRLGPVVAGSWYPAEPRELARTVETLLGEAKTAPTPEVAALIAPHAGFVYSGEVAGRAFALLRDRTCERVVLLGPSHHAWFRGAALPDASTLATPLGEVSVDSQAIDRLRSAPGFRVDPAPFAREHCLEAELPFLQRVLAPGWKALPILLGSGTSGNAAQEIADGLSPLVGPSTVFVVSSDFTHYGSAFGYRPFRDDVERKIRDLDLGAVRLIEARDTRGFEEYLARTEATICGRDGIDVLLRLLPAGIPGKLVAYDTSGSMTGDWSHTVSYASIAFLAGKLPPADPGDKTASRALSPRERETLLRLAQAAIRDAVLRDGALARALSGEDLTKALRETRGAFVTLKERVTGAASSHWPLRGCIGTIFPREPLYESVVHNAVDAATRDPRFRPVTAAELPGLALSVSALTPLVPVPGPESVEVGRHGVLLERGGSRAVFLPQVAPEQGWDRETMLEHLALKAGLPRSGWRGARLSVFEAEVFGEAD